MPKRYKDLRALSDDTYQLIDFGDGRKLESFAGRITDRPSPAASAARRATGRWREAASRYDADRKAWKHHFPWPGRLEIDCGGFIMPVAPTPFGHLGLFPEQASNWRWIHDTPPAAPTECHGLNLFGYTGATTLAMAVSGMPVAHVDAAKPNVAAARAAADRNGLQSHPIRYLIDDAAKFASREVRRQREYDTIALDPPAYGHSPKGKAWRIERDLWPLLDDCLRLLNKDSCRLLITGHSPEVGPADVIEYLRDALPKISGVSANALKSGLEQDRLTLIDAQDRSLDAGFLVRFCLRR